MPTKNAKATQDFVDIEEIRDGVIILKNRSLRVVLMASSLNFALKSAEEQDAIILQYQNFLNAVDFSVEFFVQSRSLNVEPYLDVLRDRQKRKFNELLKTQVTEYIDFIKAFVESANILTKSFYIAVPYTPVVIYKKGGAGEMLRSLFGKTEGQASLDEEKFQEYKIQLYQRVDAVRQGLIRTGVRAVPLNTEELIELFYGLYNPGELEKGKIPEMAK